MTMTFKKLVAETEKALIKFIITLTRAVKD